MFHLNIGQIRYFLRILESHLIIILIFYWIISPSVVYSTVSIVMISYCKKNSKVIHQSVNILHIFVDSFFLHHHWQLWSCLSHICLGLPLPEETHSVQSTYDSPSTAIISNHSHKLYLWLHGNTSAWRGVAFTFSQKQGVPVALFSAAPISTVYDH